MAKGSKGNAGAKEQAPKTKVKVRYEEGEEWEPKLNPGVPVVGQGTQIYASPSGGVIPDTLYRGNGKAPPPAEGQTYDNGLSTGGRRSRNDRNAFINNPASASWAFYNQPQTGGVKALRSPVPVNGNVNSPVSGAWANYNRQNQPWGSNVTGAGTAGGWAQQTGGFNAGAYNAFRAGEVQSRPIGGGRGNANVVGYYQNQNTGRGASNVAGYYENQAAGRGTSNIVDYYRSQAATVPTPRPQGQYTGDPNDPNTARWIKYWNDSATAGYDVSNPSANPNSPYYIPPPPIVMTREQVWQMKAAARRVAGDDEGSGGGGGASYYYGTTPSYSEAPTEETGFGNQVQQFAWRIGG